MLSYNSTLYFEVMPFPVEKLQTSKIVIYEAYDKDDILLNRGYLLVNNNDDFIQLCPKIYKHLGKKIGEDKLSQESDYACFLKNDQERWVLKKPLITDNVNKCISDGIIIRYQ